jgi:hypothetical protein
MTFHRCKTARAPLLRSLVRISVMPAMTETTGRRNSDQGYEDDEDSFHCLIHLNVCYLAARYKLQTAGLSGLKKTDRILTYFLSEAADQKHL